MSKEKRIKNNNKSTSEECVIILNKIFQGSWNEKDGNISHEIIDFFKSDNDEYFVYNDPWGHCPKYIYCENDEDKEKRNRTHKAKWMILTGPGSKRVRALYCIRLKKAVHHQSAGKNRMNDEIESIIKEQNIKYNGKYLHEIYGASDESLLLTFEADKIYKSKNPIDLEFSEYTFQRNKGYLTSDGFVENKKRHNRRKKEKLINDYKNLINCLEDNNGNIKSEWIEIPIKKVSEYDFKKIGSIKNNTFLDLIAKNDSETCYTNMLYKFLKNKDLFIKFCEEFKKGKEIAKSDSWNLYTEKAISGGRIDILGETEKQKVIIENKILSGLNGINEQDKKSQLSAYYDWAMKETEIEPLCFILAPDYRVEEIEEEINKFDSKMKDIYKIIEYSKIASFIENHKNDIEKEDVKNYIKDCINAFKNHSYKTKQDYYASLFIDATKK